MTIVLVGEAFGESEARIGAPFVGGAGAELIRMLGEAGIISLSSFDREYIHRFYSQSDPACLDAVWELHPEVFRTNVFNLHPPRNDLDFFCGPKSSALAGFPPLLKSRYVRKEFYDELTRLADEILARDPNVVVCLGNTPLWALAGRTAITKVRGTTLLSTHTVADYKLLATLHPAYIMRDWSARPFAIADLMKARREAAYPELRRPHREIWIEPSLEDIRNFIDTHIRGCDILSTDIETIGSRITCIGFAPSASIAIVIPFDDGRAKTGSYWPTRQDESLCWNIVRGILEDGSISKLFQNGAYDIAFLWRAYGIRTFGADEDTMLLAHALQPEMKKDLGTLGSLYSDERSWKHMRKKDETIKRDA